MSRRLHRRDIQIISKTRSVPTEKDWGDYLSDLDQKHGHGVFSGRTNEEVQTVFKRNPIEAADGLRWMPEIPFRYYMLGFRDAVVAADFESYHLASAANCFLDLVAEKLERHPRKILPIMPELLPAVEHVSRHQAKFEAEERIYGSFREKLARITSLYAAQKTDRS